jgi:hypothetical protein
MTEGCAAKTDGMAGRSTKPKDDCIIYPIPLVESGQLSFFDLGSVINSIQRGDMTHSLWVGHDYATLTLDTVVKKIPLRLDFTPEQVAVLDDIRGEGFEPDKRLFISEDLGVLRLVIGKSEQLALLDADLECARNERAMKARMLVRKIASEYMG